jgi:hypothetical protein
MTDILSRRTPIRGAGSLDNLLQCAGYFANNVVTNSSHGSARFVTRSFSRDQQQGIGFSIKL